MHHRFGEQYDRPRRDLRNDHAGGLFRSFVDLARHLEVAFVTAGNAPESSAGWSGVGKIPGRDREPLVDAVGGKVKALAWPDEGVERRSSVVRMHGPHGLPLEHADPIETVQPKPVPEPQGMLSRGLGSRCASINRSSSATSAASRTSWSTT